MNNPSNWELYSKMLLSKLFAGYVDMNNPSNLELYSKMLLFKNLATEEDMTFANPPSSEQSVLQGLAHRLGLDYEYSKATRIVRISCREILESTNIPDVDNTRSQNDYFQQDTTHARVGNLFSPNIDALQSDFAGPEDILDTSSLLLDDWFPLGMPPSPPAPDPMMGVDISPPSFPNNLPDLASFPPPECLSSSTQLPSLFAEEVIPDKRKSSEGPTLASTDHTPGHNINVSFWDSPQWQ